MALQITEQLNPMIVDAIFNGEGTNKASTAIVNLAELDQYMDLAGIGEWNYVSAPTTGAARWVNENWIAVAPASSKRRQRHEGQGGEYYTARNIMDTRSELGEIAVLGIESDNIQEASLLTRTDLDNIIGTKDRSAQYLLKGPELEATALGEVDDASPTFLPESRYELNKRQFETGADIPFNGNFSSKMADHYQFLVSEGRRSGVLPVLTSTHTAEARIDDLAITEGAYVRFMAGDLHYNNVIAGLSHLEDFDRDVLYTWNQVARALQFDNVRELLQEHPDLKYWLMNSMHLAGNMETYENGKGSHILFKSTGNALTMYRNIMNAPCYSGGTVFGEDIHTGGEVVEDAREVLRNIMMTSLPGRLIGRDENRVEAMQNALIEGEINILDRAAQPIEFQIDGETVTLTAIHGDVRWRIGIPIAKFIKVQKNYNDLMAAGQTDEASTILTGLSNSIRIEYTSRPTTPDFRKYDQSVAIQEVLMLASRISVAEGYEDFVQWMWDRGILGDLSARDIYEQTTTTGLYQEAKRCLHGNMPLDKIGQLGRMVDLVEKYATDRNPNYNTDVFEKARLGLVGLQAEGLSQSLSVVQRFNIFREDSTAYRSWGHFVNSLEDKEVRELLWYLENNAQVIIPNREEWLDKRGYDRSRLAFAMTDLSSRQFAQAA
ncbi:MAG: hypothetical protein GF364_02130 [Candidatus Lokiarchaeota archaeon]|nr:hypothetical protein [Candidatus Lokiarchaeota archaeon]